MNQANYITIAVWIVVALICVVGYVIANLKHWRKPVPPTPEQVRDMNLQRYEHELIDKEHLLTKTKHEVAGLREQIARLRKESGVTDSQVVHIVKRAAAGEQDA